MAEYNTEQKKILLEFLEKNHDNAYTIEEISTELKAKGASVGKSTVYRLMNKLVEEKTVLRSAGERGRQFVYRIIACEHCRYHLHLQCTECGKILHLDEQTSHALLRGVKSAQGFSVSEEDTVLLGKCALCQEGGK